MDKRYTFEDYRRIVDALRAPGGCPWDRAQTHESLKPCMINETVEALAAVNRGDTDNLCEELGDLLLLILLQSSIAGEEGSFTLDDVIQRAAEKMVRRHPHVFPDENGKTRKVAWDAIKAAERAGQTEEDRKAAREAERRAAGEICDYLKIHKETP